MPKAPGPETQLRHARSEIRALEKDAEFFKKECSSFRQRAERAEREAAEWKARFDKLLDRTPKEQQ